MAKPRQIIDLDPDEPFTVSLRKILPGWVQDMLSYEAETIKGTDPEFLHDMRVSARRVRAVLKIHRKFFPGKMLRRRLREIEELIGVLGPVREVDILSAELTELVKQFQANDKVTLQWLIAQQQTIRESYRRIMKEEIRRLRRTGFEQKFEELVVGIPLPKKKEALTAKRTTLRTRGREILPTILDAFLERIDSVCAYEHRADILHAQRLRGKRLRYAMEMYLPAYGPPFSECLDSVKQILGIMGRIHDLDVNIPVLKRHIRQVRRFNGGIVARRLKLPTAGIRILIRRFEDERHERFLLLCDRFAIWKQEDFRQRCIRSIS